MENIIKTFKDGLRLAYCKRDFGRSVGISIICGVGSENETAENNGISHFIEHMLFKGTTNRSAFEIVNDIESLGANINAYTSKQNTCFYTISIDEFAEKCAEILSDILFNSTFDSLEMEREKKVVIEEINMSEDENDELCFDLMSQAFFDNHPLGRTILGPKENVEKFTEKDIRNYIKNNYCAKDVVVSICGNISLERAIYIVEKYFEGKFSDINNREWKDKPSVPKSQYIAKYKDIEQANIAIAFPSFGDLDSRKYAVLIIDELFGGGMSSRLFQEVREKNGLAYNVYSYNSSYISNGMSTIYIGTNSDSVEKAVELTRDLIKDVCNKGFTKEEVEKGKNIVKGRQVLGQESTVALMRIIGRYALMFDKMYSMDEILNNVSNVTVDEVNKVFKEIYCLDKATIAYVGKKIDTNLLEILKK